MLFNQKQNPKSHQDVGIVGARCSTHLSVKREEEYKTKTQRVSTHILHRETDLSSICEPAGLVWGNMEYGGDAQPVIKDCRQTNTGKKKYEIIENNFVLFQTTHDYSWTDETIVNDSVLDQSTDNCSPTDETTKDDPALD